MTLSVWLWICTGAYALHIMEEFSFNWRDWARGVLNLQVEWTDFYVTNAIVIVLGIVAANIADAAPWVALAFPALMIINAIFFHIGQMIVSDGRFSPGTITAVILFLPIGIATYLSAENLAALEVVGSVALGAAVMAFPIVMIKVHDRDYFKQD